MRMDTLLDLRASYVNGQVRMTWKYPPNAPDTVYIYGVKQNGGELALDQRTLVTKSLRDCNTGLTFDYTGAAGADVKSVTYCVFLSGRNLSAPSMRSLQALGSCFVDVTVGQAEVQFDVKSKPCGGGFVGYRIITRSSSSFDPGILGYSYEFNRKEITVEFPGKVESGITEYPAIYLLENTPPPIVRLINRGNMDVSVERAKISVCRCPFFKSKH